MTNNSKELWKMAGKGLPNENGHYLVAIEEDAVSEYCWRYQFAYFDKLFQSWKNQIYQPDEGTMEPTDITDIVIRWWHLPSPSGRSFTVRQRNHKEA